MYLQCDYANTLSKFPRFFLISYICSQHYAFCSYRTISVLISAETISVTSSDCKNCLQMLCRMTYCVPANTRSHLPSSTHMYELLRMLEFHWQPKNYIPTKTTRYKTAHSHTFQGTDTCLLQIQQSHQGTDFFQGHTPATCPTVEKI